MVNFVSKAFALDENKKMSADIYDKVKSKDNKYISVENGKYIRLIFQRMLQNNNIITVYAKSTNILESSVDIQVYPVYDNENLGDQPLVTFGQIDQPGIYKVVLTNLQNPTQVIELKMVGDVDIDYVVDPTPIIPEDNPAIPTIMQDSQFSENQQSLVLVKPFLSDGTTNVGFYIPYGTPPIWTWQSETPSIGDKPFSDYWGPIPAVGDYTAVEYFNDQQQFSCSDLSLPDCINDSHFVSQFIFKITQPNE